MPLLVAAVLVAAHPLRGVDADSRLRRRRMVPASRRAVPARRRALPRRLLRRRSPSRVDRARRRPAVAAADAGAARDERGVLRRVARHRLVAARHARRRRVGGRRVVGALDRVLGTVVGDRQPLRPGRAADDCIRGGGDRRARDRRRDLVDRARRCRRGLRVRGEAQRGRDRGARTRARRYVPDASQDRRRVVCDHRRRGRRALLRARDRAARTARLLRVCVPEQGDLPGDGLSLATRGDPHAAALPGARDRLRSLGHLREHLVVRDPRVLGRRGDRRHRRAARRRPRRRCPPRGRARSRPRRGRAARSVPAHRRRARPGPVPARRPGRAVLGSHRRLGGGSRARVGRGGRPRGVDGARAGRLGRHASSRPARPAPSSTAGFRTFAGCRCGGELRMRSPTTYGRCASSPTAACSWYAPTRRSGTSPEVCATRRRTTIRTRRSSARWVSPGQSAASRRARSAGCAWPTRSTTASSRTSCARSSSGEWSESARRRPGRSTGRVPLRHFPPTFHSGAQWTNRTRGVDELPLRRHRP